MTSAASAWTRATMLSAVPTGTPVMPARRNRARNDSPAATAHTSVDSQATGMPSICARSLCSAAPRTAVPSRVLPRNSATATIAIGATIRAMKSLALRMNVPIVSFQSTGGGMRCEVALSPHMRGTSRASTASSWVMPIVATVRTSRDDLVNRLTKCELDDRPECDRGDQADAEPEQVGEPGEDDQADGERGRHEPEVGLGEVDDPVGAVDERHAHRQQRGEEAEHDAAHPRARWHAEPDELDGHQCDGGREWAHVSRPAIRAPSL